MKHQQPTLRFLGATDTVTGSGYLLDAGCQRALVDCGLFQRYKRSRVRNRASFPVPPRSIDAVVLTHTRLDHTGCVPAMVWDGFGGPVIATAGTTDLCKLRPDSGYLQEKEGRYATHRGSSRHSPALPIYTAAHSTVDPEQQLGEIINRVAKRRGGVLFAAFAAGRAETLMLHLSRLRSKNRIQASPVYLNSPMAVGASGKHQRHPEEHRLNAEEYLNLYKLAKLTRSVDESKLLILRGGPMITHGEQDASDALRLRIKRGPGQRARVQEHLEKISLEDPR